MANDAIGVIWITGASSGLGFKLALELAKQGNKVIASGRNVEALNDLASHSTNIYPLPFDLSSENDLFDVQEKLKNISAYLDCVILNAGVCEYQDFPEPDWSAVPRVMGINFQATVNCVELSLPLLRNRSQHSSGKETNAHIVGISSQVIFAPFPRAQAYGASKSAFDYFFHSLRIDLSKENIDVTVVNPGFIDTPMTRQNNFPMPFKMTVEDAAKRIVGALKSHPYRYIFPKRLYFILLAAKIFPSLWVRMLRTSKSKHQNVLDESV